MSACVYLETNDDLEELNSLVWRAEPTSFIPHGTPGTLGATHGGFTFALKASELPDADLLLLLTHRPPQMIAELCTRFPKIIDIVSASDPELSEGRDRFRFYRDQNLEIKVVNRGS